MEVKLKYARVQNAGDLINENIIRDIFHMQMEEADAWQANLSAIGSGLGRFQHETTLKRKAKDLIRSGFKPLHIWGTGFINYPAENDPPFFRRCVFHAVRGELTRRRLEKIYKKNMDIPTCDAGLLAPELMQGETFDKRYELGVIPHCKEQDEPEFAALVQEHENSLLIDITLPPVEVLRQIAQCKLILSSSLHGLIFSDALRVPSYHIVVTDKLRGDGYKFDDYYSCFGVEHRFCNLRTQKLPPLESLYEQYAITDAQIKEKQRQLHESFPFK